MERIRKIFWIAFISFFISCFDAPRDNENDPFSYKNVPVNAQWAKSITAGSSDSEFKSIATDGNGNVYTAGYVRGTGTFTFGTDMSGANVSVAGVSSDGNIVLVKYDSSGIPQWAKTVTGGSGDSWLNSVAVDSSGNVYAAGYIRGTGTFTFGTDMSGANVSVSGVSSGANIVLVKYDSSGIPQWAKTVTGSSGDSWLNSVAVDSSGNVYTAGFKYGTGTYTFGTDVSGSNVSVSGVSSGANIVLVKYDSSGIPQWAKTVTGSSGDSWLNSVTVDNSGNVYAAGYINGNGMFTFGTDMSGANVSAAGASSVGNILLLKYNSSGIPQWAQTIYPGGFPTISVFYSVATDSASNVYAVGTIEGRETYTFGTNVIVKSAGNPSCSNIVLVKYNSSGVAQWGKTVGGNPSSSIFNSVAIDSSDNVYAAGSFTSGVTYIFNNNIPITGILSGGYGTSNPILVKYNSSGTAKWTKTISAGSVDPNLSFSSVAVDKSGNYYAAGYIYGTGASIFGTGVSTKGGSSTYNVLLIKYK